MEFYQVIWFVLWGTLWAVYFTLDGFDFGAAILQKFIAKSDDEKRMISRSVGPVWDGNEVWLLTAGGATFAAFPTAYALMFSYLYSALLLILFSLIFRGIALEFREKAESASWKRSWDNTVCISSFLLSLLFGVAFGNIFQGLPMDDKGYHGSLISLLNPYGLLTGVFFVLLFVEHGALYIAVKIDNPLSERAAKVAGKLWYALLTVAVIFLVFTAFATKLYANYLATPAFFVVPFAAVLALLGTKIFAARGSYLKAFFSSATTILSVTFTGVIGLYPNLIPSSLNPEYSLTIFNSSSSAYTLKIMTAVAFIFVPIVIAYQIWVYRVFRNKITAKDITEEESY
ncbi:MAG: cytochrome d ubiquinol oxidase subunit II [Nitrospirae bacterium]|nr:cytochrome d ubiquinol oxidase subunit II [Nitrospirota bacterium]